MNIWPVIANLINRVPIERFLFPPRNDVKELENFVATLSNPASTIKEPPEQKAAPELKTPLASTKEPGSIAKQGTVATACVPCALGHFSTSTGLLNEAVRFKHEGITSNEILDRIAKVLEEQNTLERVDLAPEKLQETPEWEREIAEEALLQSRQLRHRLETITSIDELMQAAADTATYYKKLNRQWYKAMFAHAGPGIEKRA